MNGNKKEMRKRERKEMGQKLELMEKFLRIRKLKEGTIL